MAILDKMREKSPPALSVEGIEMARTAQRCIMESLDRSRAAVIQVTTDDGEEGIAVPPQALKLIGQMLGLMAQNKAFSLIPEDHEFTTVQAANLLNVSRPFVIKEINELRLKHRMVGSHRRISLEHLLEYQQTMRDRQAEALARLSASSDELGLPY